MSIRINITSCNCRAGGTISGTVSLHGDKDINIQLLSICLIGRSETNIRRSRDEDLFGRALLFEHKQVLFQGPRTLHPGRHWLFTFTIPPRCTARTQDIFIRHSVYFNPDPSQSLPPSFSDSCGGWGRADITYTLMACLTSGNWSTRKIEVQKTLDFSTTRAVEAPNPLLYSNWQTITCHSLRLQPGQEDVPLTFKEKLKSMRTSKLPVAIFTLQMLFPTIGIVEQVLPLILKIDHNIEASTTMAPPLVFLRKCAVELLTTTHVRAPRRLNEERQEWTVACRIDSMDPRTLTDKALPVTESMDLGRLVRPRISRCYGPTIATFNIGRTYKLRIIISVECAQKTFKATFTTLDLRLLAEDYYRPISGDAAQACLDVSDAVDEREVAPPYDDPYGKLPPRYEDSR
ncbi:hypothetical protein MMC28_008492 [Mycoblastus sanguinarius]|nr:hypothetical protein [Mycoblastus sanguinarius]